MKTLGDNTDKAANDAKNAGNGGFTVFKGVLSNLTTQVISKCVDALKDMSKQLVSVVTDTAAAGDNIDKMSQKNRHKFGEFFKNGLMFFERSGANIDGLEAGMKKAVHGHNRRGKRFKVRGRSVKISRLVCSMISTENHKMNSCLL